MYPLNAILIGCDEQSMPHVRRELMNRSAGVEAEFSNAGSAIDVLRKSPGEKRLLIFHVKSPREIDELARLTISFPRWPVVAVLGEEDYSNGSVTTSSASCEPVPPRLSRSPSGRTTSRWLSTVSPCSACDSVTDTKVIAVAGATGGSGATTIAINLAYEIACQRGLRCILVDLSLKLGVVASYLNLEPEHTIMDLLRDINRLDKRLTQRVLIRVTENLQLLAGPNQPVAPVTASAQDLNHVVDTLKQIADVVVLDVPCTYDEIYLQALATQPSRTGRRAESPRSAPSRWRTNRSPAQRNRTTGNQQVRPEEEGLLGRTPTQAPGSSQPAHGRSRRSCHGRRPGQRCPLRLAAPRSPALSDIVALTESLLGLAPAPRARPVGLIGRLGRALSNK